MHPVGVPRFLDFSDAEVKPWPKGFTCRTLRTSVRPLRRNCARNSLRLQDCLPYGISASNVWSRRRREFEATHHLVEASALARRTYLEYFAPQRFRHFIETSLATRNSQQA
jgi:hypothetical protein